MRRIDQCSGAVQDKDYMWKIHKKAMEFLLQEEHHLINIQFCFYSLQKDNLSYKVEVFVVRPLFFPILKISKVVSLVKYNPKSGASQQKNQQELDFS